MSYSKDQWEQEIENTVERFVGGDLDYKESFQILVRLGLDNYEAQTMLDEAVA